MKIHSFEALPSRFQGLYVDFNKKDSVEEHYIPRVKSLLFEKLPEATQVVVFDQNIRAGPGRYSLKAHIDQSPNGAYWRARRHLDLSTFVAIKRGKKRFAIINVWKPILGPVTDHPLAFADCRSIKQSDLVAKQRVYADFIGERYELKAGSHQKYWYWSGMTEEDVLLLQVFDSTPVKGFGDGSQPFAQCAHGAFQLKEDGTEPCERRSIEVRCLVVF